MRRHLLRWSTGLALVAAALGVPRLATAQATATITGQVVDSVARRPVAGVAVTVVGTTRGAVSDSAGRYALRGVPPGGVTLRTQRLGYSPATRRLTVAAGETVTADLALAATATTLSEVVTLGYGENTRANVSNAVTTVSAEAVQNTPVAGVDAALQGKA